MTFNVSRNNAGAVVVLPDPFGPANTTTLGSRLFTAHSLQGFSVARPRIARMICFTTSSNYIHAGIVIKCSWNSALLWGPRGKFFLQERESMVSARKMM
jgi:hypothetical protein